MIPTHALEILKEIKKTGKKFSIHESGFLASVAVQAKSNRILTDRQGKWLQDIYQKCTEIAPINGRGN